MNRTRHLFLALCFLMLAGAANAQFEIKSATFNRLRQAPVNTTGATPGQFASKGETSASSGPISTGFAQSTAIRLRRGRFGGVFASGVPRYELGDQITVPLTRSNGTGTVPASYWRSQPVQYGEVFTHPNNSQETPLPNPNAPSAAPAQPYYYSPHADRVFAHQAGRVTVMWVTAVPVNIDGNASPTGLYRFRSETFSVSSSTTRPLRTIYWTERSFNGPKVSIPIGSIVTVNPVYSTFFPETVTTEHEVAGINPPATPELRTLWFENLNGLAQLRAYNREGRIFVEYLGTLDTETGKHAFLGADIVEVQQAAVPTVVNVWLGEELRAHDESLTVPENADELQGSAVLNLGQVGENLYGTGARPNGRPVYHAEKETDNPDQVAFYWLEEGDPSVFLGASAPNLDIFWPKHLNKYNQVWPASISDYAGITVEDSGSTVANSIQFSGANLPEVVHQDDRLQEEVTLDTATQRLLVDFSNSTDRTNRTLIRFNNGTEVWYQRLFIQSHTVLGIDPDGAGPLVAVPTLADLNANGVADLVNASVLVGQRIERPDSTHEIGGYISSGTNYLPAAYRNPLTQGVAAAASGAIIPVNANPNNNGNVLKIWWFKKVTAPSSRFDSFYVPSKSGTYTVSSPTGGDQIVLASNAGSGDLSAAQAAGTIYYQNNPGQPGHNPNEEHAVMLGGRVYALRQDLNVTSGTGYTSAPLVLLSFTNPADGRPSARTFRVLREVDLAGTANDILFNYAVTAGSIIQPPMPLPLLPVPLNANGTGANYEVAGTVDAAPHASAPDEYDSFTYLDRKGYSWVYRGPHAGAANSTLGMKFFYAMQEGFFVPGMTTQPAAGTLLPYLRQTATGTLALADEPRTIIYRPTWPASAPSLRVAETLTLPKFGLPQVRGQSSAKIIYQQSIATGGTTMDSVTLHDPTRAKTVFLSAQQLVALPSSIATTTQSGRTYFQRLPPHLQKRCYVRPFGQELQLVLEGVFNDAIAGEDYLDLNVLSTDDKAHLYRLENPDWTPASARTAWQDLVDDLVTQVDTFIEDPAKRGTYRVGSTATVGVDSLAAISSSDTAVDSYALTTTGKDDGYVTLVFGDGVAFTEKGDPVVMQIIKVVPQLYVGDMKVLFSSNPLDEQVTLRHSGDFAGRPQDYEFEWRYAQPVNGQPPAHYLYTLSPHLDETTSWRRVQNPAAALPTASEYTAGAVISLPAAVQVKDANRATSSANPGLVLRSETHVNFTSIPAEIIFSADLSNDFDGFVVYVNAIPALAFRHSGILSPSNPISGLSPNGLPLQFRIAPGFFDVGANVIEIAMYTDADPLIYSGVNFRLEASTEVDQVVLPGSPWIEAVSGQSATYPLSGLITIGGSPTAPLGSPLLLMQDNYFTVRYRPKVGNVAGTGWSRWMDPAFVPGWVKRVLDGINPFNQRITDLFNSSVNTDVSVLTQAGTRWEGDIALNLDSVNNTGLIAIYETVLNRARLFSVDAGYDTPGTNDALLLAAGYLNDLYTILGNEAYADAANPTISLDDQTTITEVNTSRFSFEGQVSSVIEEELALLRGRDDFLVPSVRTTPSYNRLFWNYTNGINSGEVLYATNYNIKEKAGSSTQNGIIDAADAQRMFPQGHGDAYGHYLTALKGYYKLLTHPNFTWTPRSEVTSVLGQAISIDYKDERKFAAAAASLARTAEQILALTTRQSYRDDAAAGWQHLRDNKLNTQTNERRDWGVDEWASRSTQGAFIHWVVGNAMLPDVDNNPQHTGIQIIDRSTVPELSEIATAASSFQTTADNTNARLNPLGLSPGAIAFDISPTELKAGHSHFEQVYDRALQAVLNAKGSFDQAGRMTRLLRNQENQIDDYNTAIQDQERAFTYELMDIFGTPYTADIGAGKTYAQGYTGPDLLHWFLVDQASDLIDLTQPVTINIREPRGIDEIFGLAEISVFGTDYFLDRLSSDDLWRQAGMKSVTVKPNQYAQTASSYFGGNAGQRTITGELQTAIVEAQQAQMLLVDTLGGLQIVEAQFETAYRQFVEMVTLHEASLSIQRTSADEIIKKATVQKRLESAALFLDTISSSVENIAGAAAEFMPKVVGIDNDIAAPARGSLVLAGVIAAQVGHLTAAGLTTRAGQIDTDVLKLETLRDDDLAVLGYDYEQRQFVHEWEMIYTEVLNQTGPVFLQAVALQHATEKVANLLAKGDRILSEREIFRRRAAAIVQGYRTRDVTFRTFRNEALEQYRGLFDLASRYAYLAAKSYDYETGLLGTSAGQGVISSIVSSRALGDITNGVPQSTASANGDAGLAAAMARLRADFSVAEGRLGINNPDQNGTLFSLRHELFRILDDDSQTDDDAAWQQTLEQHIVSNLMSDPDAATLCRNLRKTNGSAVPGILIPFSSAIAQGYNWFGLPTAGGDHGYSTSSYSTKIYSAGMVLKGYVGMNPYAFGTPNAGGPATSGANVLSATPYIYLIPTGMDSMLAPPLGNTGDVRTWQVHDQALPLPYNLGASDFNSVQFFNANGTLSEQPWINRKHQAFRAVNDPAFFYSTMPAEFTSSRLVGRSVWNSGWKIVIPAYTLLNNEQEGLNRFVRSVKDIQIFLRTYSHSGN